MPQTTNYALPTPTLQDTYDVPADMQTLADRVDEVLTDHQASIDALVRIRVGYGDSLPTADHDGQKIVCQAASGGDAWWEFAWDSNASYWSFTGGAPLMTRDATAGTRGGTAYAQPTTGSVGPTVTIPFTGVYAITFGANMGSSADGTGAYVGVSINGGAVDDDSAAGTGNGNKSSVTGGQGTEFSANAGEGAALKYSSASGTSSFDRRWISVTPIYITS